MFWCHSRSVSFFLLLCTACCEKAVAQLFGGEQQEFHASGNFTCGESVVHPGWYSGLSFKVEKFLSWPR